ncbi:GNAT family N-acetyltransferase [Paenibacillus whitsoniae]|uniref:GNAT family N-acetyltransferase n=1 Tax=Paenibacillus whitsoniae TaxID=2496558 RepID=A0A430J414_9BACL|nr:GNAT family N-acetyltransferase [Paenibacillus whitsoniae]RTE01393.1 GNAT family N-acetyltransferase [Paenibacillus whitsoniae]
MTNDIRYYRFLDGIAACAWPSERTDALGSWQLRASEGVTRRANSVLTNGEFPAKPDWLEEIERYYRALELPAIFQVGDASPAGLDVYLEANGYLVDTPCVIMTAESGRSAQLAQDKLARRCSDAAAPEVRLAPSASQAWISRFLQLEGYAESRRNFYIKLYDRMPAPKAFVQLRLGDRVIGVATVVVEGEWAGFFNVVIDEAHRGNGYGYHLLAALSSWSLEQGASRLYLQVVADNKPAQNLYRKLGFDTVYRYHYRVKQV